MKADTPKNQFIAAIVMKTYKKGNFTNVNILPLIFVKLHIHIPYDIYQCFGILQFSRWLLLTGKQNPFEIFWRGFHKGFRWCFVVH